jgi:multidrug efflux pump subunit AcrB
MHGMINWFARNEVAANLLMVLILAIGTWSMSTRVPMEIFPSFERDVINIALSYRGATPSEVEEAVVVRVEEAIANIEGIKQIDSFAYEGSCRVSVEIEKGLNPRDLLDDIKNKIDRITTFPENVERPSYAVQVFRRNVISVAVSGDLPEAELRHLGEQVRDDLITLPEVSLVELTGVRPYELAIEISQANLQRYGITFQDVVNAVRRSSVDLPAGSIKSIGGEVLLRTKGQAYDAHDFNKITILTRTDGTRLTLADIATIKDGFEEETLLTDFNNRPAVMIEVYRTGMQDAIEIGKAVRDYVNDNKARMPAGITLDYWRDRSRIVNLRLQTLLTSAWQGGLLVFLCLALFLRLSVAIWVCVGIPISFMGAMLIMPEIGVTLNLISLFAFILVLGIVVDDAIITGENIYTHLNRAEPGLHAAITGAQEVAVPVTFGLLTTLAAFMPLMFMEGHRGPLFAQIPMVVIPVLLFSWIESKLILPAHLKHININDGKKPGLWTRFQQKFATGLENGIRNYYQPVLKLVLKHRYLTFALFIAFSIIVVSFVISGRYGFTFFPKIPSETARVTLVMQKGTSESVTTQHIERMADIARELQKKYSDKDTGQSVINNILTSVGWRVGRRSISNSAEVGQISLELVPPEARTINITTRKLVNEWRKKIGAIPGARELTFRAEIGHSGSPVSVQLIGRNVDDLKAISDKVKERLAEYPGLYDIQDTLEDGKAEIVLKLKPEAEQLGLSVEDLGRQVRHAFFGAEAQRLQRGRDDVRVIVRFPQAERRSLASLDSMLIRNAQGVEVPIGNVTSMSMGQSAATIHRKDRQRMIEVTSDADKKKIDAIKIRNDLEELLSELTQHYHGVHYSFGGEMKEQRETFTSLFYSIIFVLFAIYILLAIPLRSYAQPIIVMLIIPFSFIGALLGHFIMDMTLSVMSIMGMLALTGVVVNDSLILVDWINRRTREGSSIKDAARIAGVARFRPILLTSLTTFFGLTPLLLEKSTQAQFLIPMGVSLGFGILYATLLSLLLIPATYLILADIKYGFKKAINFIYT